MNDELVHEGNALGVSESCLVLIILRQVIQQFQNESAEAGSLENLNQFGNHALLVDLLSDFQVERKIEQNAKSDLKKHLVVAGYEAIQVFNDAALFHFCLVFAKNGQLLDEVEHNEKQVRIVSVQHAHQLRNDFSIFHLPLNLQIFSKVQQQMESNEQNLFLLLDHDAQFPFLFAKIVSHLLVTFSACSSLQIFHFLFELFHSNHVALDFMLNDADGCVTDLVGAQKLVELREVGVSLKDVEQVKSKVN